MPSNGRWDLIRRLQINLENTLKKSSNAINVEGPCCSDRLTVGVLQFVLSALQ